MKFITCPGCGFKNIADNPRCSRCNELLINNAVARPVRTAARTPPVTPLVVFNPKSSAAPAPPAPIPSPGSPGSPSPIPSPGSTSSPVPYTPPTSPLTNPAPFGSSPFSQPFGTPAPIAPPSPLPGFMKKFGPCTVEGVIIDTGQTQNVDYGLKAGDIVHGVLSGVLLATKPFMGMMSIASGARRPKEFNTVLTYRIETPTNEIFDVRVEKDMIGASINLRDYISIWGKRVGGVIILLRGYNHTVKGEIRLR